MRCSETFTFQNLTHKQTNFATAPYEYKYNILIGDRAFGEQVEIFLRAIKQMDEITIKIITQQTQLTNGKMKQRFTFSVEKENVSFKEFRYKSSLGLQVDKNTWEPRSFTLWRNKQS